MEQHIECLSCGQLRERAADECPRCRYVGWAFAADLNERIRRLLRDRPVARRRLHAV